MTEEELSELVRQAVNELADELSAVDEDVANTTSNISGYDAPFGAKLKQKSIYHDLDDEDDNT